MCDLTNGNYVGYHDCGIYGDSGWRASTLTQPNGLNTFPLTIKRTTSDGIWTLTQAFSRSTTAPSVKIATALRNNSAVGKWAYFERFADIDGGGIYNSSTAARFPYGVRSADAMDCSCVDLRLLLVWPPGWSPVILRIHVHPSTRAFPTSVMELV